MTARSNPADAQAEIPLAEVDVLDLRWFTDGPPHALFARMRAEDPVHRNPGPEGTIWSLTRHDDISAVSRDTATFSSHRGSIFLTKDDLMPLEIVQLLLLMKDPPEHTQYRLVLQKAFTPATVAKLEESVRDRVASLVDAAIERKDGDFVSDLAVPTSLGVLMRMMGVPETDFARFFDWTERTERATREMAPGGVTEVFADMGAYLAAQIEQQRASADDTIVKRLLDGEVHGRQLDDTEILVFFGLLAFAGNDTTRNTASLGMLALLEHPEQLELLRADPSLVPGAIEEILRWTTVVNWFTRTVTRDTRIRGQAIAEGDRVLMWYSSASRDENVFQNPQRFDVRRAKSEHKAFGGGGRHFCLGAGLARLELRVLFEELIKRVEGIEQTGPAERLPSNWANGLSALPVRMTAR